MNTAEWLRQILGLSLSRVREASEARSAIFNLDRRLLERRRELLRESAKAYFDRDAKAMAKVRAEIVRFNQAQPSHAISAQGARSSLAQGQRRTQQANMGVYLPRKRQALHQVGRFADVE